MKKKNLKRSLLLSVLSLLLCVSTFVGTTFAWFSETITNQKNKIMAGNLDVALYYMTEDMADWEEVDENTVIFPEDALWEPGFTQVVYFKVVNKGTLALKYQFAIDVVDETTGINVDGDVLTLSDHIKFGVVQGDTHAPFADRADAIAKVDATSKKISEGFTKAGELVAGTTTTPSEQYVSMAVYMPSTVGNEANYKTGTVAPVINLGIELYATQMMNEDDSFGTDYDKDAQLPATKTEDVVAGEETVIENENGSVTIPAGATTAEELTYTVAPTDVPANITIEAGEKSVAYEVNLLDENGNKVTTTEPVEASIFVGKDLVVTKLYHNDQEIAFNYNPATGYITFETTSFSPFTVVSKDVSSLDQIATADELVAAAANGGYYNVVADIDLGTASVKVAEGKALYLRLNGKTIYGESEATGKNAFLFEVYGTLTLEGGKVASKHVGADMSWNNCTQTLYVGGNGTLNVQNATVENLGGTSMAYAIDMTNAKTITVNVENSVISSTYIAVRVFNNSNGMNNVTIEGTEMIGATRAFWVHIYSNTDTKGKGTKDATLNLDIYGNGNTFTATNPKYPSPICYGFDDGYLFDVEGKFVCAAADTAAGLKAAIEAGYDVILTSNITLTETVVINKALTLDGNGKTLTYTGTNRAIEIPMEANGANVTIKNLTIDASKAERGINYNTNGMLVVENVTVTSVSYAINFPTYSDNAKVTVANSKLTSSIALNIWGSDMEITVTNSELYSVESDPNFSYAAIQLNRDEANGHIAEGTTVTVNGGKLSATDEEGELGIIVSNWTATGEVVISDTTEQKGDIKNAVATYGGACAYTLQQAIDEVIRLNFTCPIVLIRDIELSETATIPAGAKVTLDLNGKTITAPAGAICAIQNEGTLTVKGNGTITGSYSALYSNGKLTVEGGNFTATDGFGLLIDNIYGTEASVAEINGGTFTGVGIYNPTEVTINGGTFNVGRDPDGASDGISDAMTLFISPTFVGVTNTATVTLNGGTFNGDVYVYDDGITETVFTNNGATINGDVLDNG